MGRGYWAQGKLIQWVDASCGTRACAVLLLDVDVHGRLGPAGRSEVVGVEHGIGFRHVEAILRWRLDVRPCCAHPT